MDAGPLLKNPNRVPDMSQRVDPVGRWPGNPDALIVVRAEENPVMPHITQTGVYVDREGRRFQYVEGHPLTAQQEAELTMESAGLPRTEGEQRQDALAEERAARIDESAGRVESSVRAQFGAPAENRMDNPQYVNPRRKRGETADPAPDAS